jgi:hypothetical protein
MKKVHKKIKILAVVLLSFFFGFNKGTKAATPRDITSRVNKIRSTLQEKVTNDKLIKLTGKDIANENLNEWVNWGNWANWNNWNNWNNWAKWSNWGNWRNF